MTAERSRLYCCSSARAAIELSDPRAAVLGLDRYAGWIRAGYEGPLTWRRSWGSRRVTGYEAETRLRFTADIAALEFVDQERSDNPSNPYLCENATCDDYLDFALDVQLATADGAMSGGGVIHGTTEYLNSVAAAGDLPIAGFTGTLDLANEVEPPRLGGVSIGLRFSNDGLQGALTPWITQQSAPDLNTVVKGPLLGTWPLPTCIEQGLPLQLDAPVRETSPRSAREFFERVIPEFEAAARAPAQWLDGSVTEVSIQLAGDIDHGCTVGGAGPVHLTVPVRLRTTDGRLDMILPADFGLNWDSEEGPLAWGWRLSSDVMDLKSVLRWMGDSEGATRAAEDEVILQVASGPDYGILRVSGEAEAQILESLTWCLSTECPTNIRL